MECCTLCHVWLRRIPIVTLIFQRCYHSKVRADTRITFCKPNQLQFWLKIEVDCDKTKSRSFSRNSINLTELNQISLKVFCTTELNVWRLVTTIKYCFFLKLLSQRRIKSDQFNNFLYNRAKCLKVGDHHKILLFLETPYGPERRHDNSRP